MSERTGSVTPLDTKLCPRCGAELYADMGICYGCLYDFSRARESSPPEGMPAVPEEPARGDTVDLSAAAELARGLPGEIGVLVRTASVDLWSGVPEEGVALGRAADNDVVLHSPAVSAHHLRLVPTPDGMEVCDLDSTNPARYRGREVRGRVVVPYGDSLDVCGCVITVTGPAGSA